MNEKEKELAKTWDKGIEWRNPPSPTARETIKNNVLEAIRTAVADTEKKVMEKYNSIGRVVEKSTEMQLEKWEEAIRVDERQKTAEAICLLIDELESTDKNTSMEQWKNYKRIRNTIRDKYVLQALKGGDDRAIKSHCHYKDKRTCC